MSYRRIKGLHRIVYDILEENASARNSDIDLMIRVWRVCAPSKIRKGATGKDGVWLDDLYDLPQQDAVSRCRRKIQESGQFLPTDERIARERRLNMDEWRVAMGYPTVSTAGTAHPSWKPPSEQ